jgi:hypothetical protein
VWVLIPTALRIQLPEGSGRQSALSLSKCWGQNHEGDLTQQLRGLFVIVISKTD